MELTISGKVHSRNTELTLLNEHGANVASINCSVSTIKNKESVLNSMGEPVYILDKSYNNNSYKYKIHDAIQSIVTIYRIATNGKINIYAKGAAVEFSINHNYDCTSFSLYNRGILVATMKHKKTLMNREFMLDVVNQIDQHLTYAVALAVSRLIQQEEPNRAMEIN